MSDSRPAVPREPQQVEEGRKATQLRNAISRLRDAARTGGLDFRERDPLVMLLHNAVDELMDLRAAASRWEARALAADQETRCNICDQPILHEIVCEDCLSERGFALAADQRETWQPIETAPKDGQWLLFVERDLPTRSDLHLHPDMQESSSTTIGRFRNGECERYGIGLINVWLLTHWMPLPEPPKPLPAPPPPPQEGST